MTRLVNAWVAPVGLLRAASGLGGMIDPARISGAWDVSRLCVLGGIKLRGNLGGLSLGLAGVCGLYFVDGSKWPVNVTLKFPRRVPIR